MDEKERKELLSDVGDVMEHKLKLHHAANGYVMRDTFDASTKVMTRTLGEVTGAVEKLHTEVKVQCRATKALGEITGKLSTDLIAHTAEHAGEEKAEGKRARKWKQWAVVTGIVVAVLTLFGTFGAWFLSEMEAAREKPVTIMIDDDAAREIAKAINGDD